MIKNTCSNFKIFLIFFNFNNYIRLNIIFSAICVYIWHLIFRSIFNNEAKLLLLVSFHSSIFLKLFQCLKHRLQRIAIDVRSFWAVQTIPIYHFFLALAFTDSAIVSCRLLKHDSWSFAFLVQCWHRRPLLHHHSYPLSQRFWVLFFFFFLISTLWFLDKNFSW